MYSIYKKEINTFFSSLIAYIVIATYLVMIGLFTWVFPDTSILDFGYATLDPLFSISPLVLMFLIPAITMRSFAEEKQRGTVEFLFTQPISDLKIILGKYLAYLSLVVIGVLPTLIYYYSVYQLGSPVGNIDSGEVIGSYIGLLFLSAAFVSIGVFASTLTDNQIVAFILAAFLCFFCHWAFSYIATIPAFIGNGDDFINRLGINYHYVAMSKGKIDSRNVLYFLSVVIFFGACTLTSLNRGR